MEGTDFTVNPLVIQNYDLLNKIGIFEHIQSLKVENRELEDLIEESYNISKKESINEIVNYLINCLSEKFIPSKLIILLNEDIGRNRIKTISFTNLKREKINFKLNTLEPFENFFRKNPGTINFSILEMAMDSPQYMDCFKDNNIEIIIPILGHSGLYGMILFGPKMLQEDYTLKEIAYIDKLMKFISLGIKNNIHYEHSVKDLKTGLYNHSFFIKRVQEELARSKRNQSTFSLLIMDIDHFKIFNDTYGHLAGDEVIIAIASKLKHELREEDIISRFGGEEFTVLLPNCNEEVAKVVAERVRLAIEEMSIEYESEVLKVTVSVGVTINNWKREFGANYLINKADEALYRSKESGRNRVTLYKPGLLFKSNTLNI